MLIKLGRQVGLGIGTVFLVAIIYGIYKLQDKSIRTIAGFEAVPEVLGRAMEMGRPVHFSPGLGGLSDAYAPQTIAGLAMMGHLARLCARNSVKYHVSVGNRQTFVVATEMVRSAYHEENADDEWNQDIVRFCMDQRGMMAHCMGLFSREKIGANVLLGGFYWEAVPLAEHGAAVGAMQIVGSSSQSQLPTLMAAADYAIIGDEMFATAAIISQNKMQIGSVAGQDIIRILVVILMLIGLGLSLIGSDWLAQVLYL